MKYRKRRVLVDALQWTGENHRELFDFLTNNTMTDKPMESCGYYFFIEHGRVNGGLVLRDDDASGGQAVFIDQFIIKEGDRFYPLNAKLFHRDFEVIE